MCAQQLLRPVQIRQNGVQQFGALLDGGGYRSPFRRSQNQGKRIDRPGPHRVLRIAVDVVGRAVFVDQPLAFLPAPCESGFTHRFQRFDQRPPVRAHVAFGVHHLVVVVAVRTV